jgi:hypothetical protein
MMSKLKSQHHKMLTSCFTRLVLLSVALLGCQAEQTSTTQIDTFKFNLAFEDNLDLNPIHTVEIWAMDFYDTTGTLIECQDLVLANITPNDLNIHLYARLSLPYGQGVRRFTMSEIPEGLSVFYLKAYSDAQKTLYAHGCSIHDVNQDLLTVDIPIHYAQ